MKFTNFSEKQLTTVCQAYGYFGDLATILGPAKFGGASRDLERTVPPPAPA